MNMNKNIVAIAYFGLIAATQAISLQSTQTPQAAEGALDQAADALLNNGVFSDAKGEETIGELQLQDQAAEGSSGGSSCSPCSSFSNCNCPHLQDAVIDTSNGNGSGFGTVESGLNVVTAIGTDVEEYIADRASQHATATNSCGLEVTNVKECGEALRYKCFDIAGNINVCEHIRTYGCDGERACSDGRFTKTSQSFSTASDTVTTGFPGALCPEGCEPI